MKKTLAIVIAVVIMLSMPIVAVASSASKEFRTVTLEDILSGRCDGETVVVSAKALKLWPRYYNLIYVWAVESETGEFIQASTSSTDWMVTEQAYNKAPRARQEAIDDGEVMLLKVNVRTSENIKVEAFITMEEEPFDSTNFSEIITVIVAVIVIVILFVVGFAILFAVEKHKKAAYAALSASVVKTKFIDSSHTATSTSRTSTSSAIGRAAVGSMIAGPVGAVVGASTAKQRHTVNEHHTTTFMVYYSDGTHRHETVENNSSKYNLYMSKLEL